MSDETMKDRAAQAAIATWNDDSPNGKTIAGLRDKFLAFAESEVRASLAPREQSPELADAERTLRGLGVPGTVEAVIVAELDRLRAENRRLSQPAPAQSADTVDVTYYAAGESSDSLYSKYSDPDDSVCLREAPQDAADDADDDERVYSVRTIITRHDGSAPAQDRATRVVYVNATSEKQAEATAFRGYTNQGSAERWRQEGQRMYRVETTDVTAERAGKDGT